VPVIISRNRPQPEHEASTDAHATRSLSKPIPHASLHLLIIVHLHTADVCMGSARHGHCRGTKQAVAPRAKLAKACS
jgi:hypothetical protein